MPDEEGLTRAIIGAAIEVHRVLGPGLLESAYQKALGTELRWQRIRFESQVHIPAVYKGVALDSGYRVDLIIENEVVVELKATPCILAVHEAQLLTYLRLLELRIGLLINFNVGALKDGVELNRFAAGEAEVISR